MSAPTALAFAELLEGFDVAATEFVSIGHYIDDGEFLTAVGSPDDMVAYADSLPEDANVFFGVNRVKGPARTNACRGKEADVTRRADLPVDLDFKPGGCPDRETALKIVFDLSVVVGTRPSILVDSGHGVHAHWPIEDGQVGDGDISAIRALTKRWRRVVEMVAEVHHVHVDNVFDLPRMMRLPGSYNNKNRKAPILVTAQRDSGGPLTMAEVAERFDEFGVVERVDDRVPAAVEVSPPDSWVPGDRTCNYVSSMLARWPTDRPELGGARNPFVYNRHIRLFCALRRGCITERDFERGQQILDDLITELVTTTEPYRNVKHFEFRDFRKHAMIKAASKTDAEVDAELNDHNHPGVDVPATVGQADGQSGATGGSQATSSTTAAAPPRPHLRDRLLNLEQLGQLQPTAPLIDGLVYRNTLTQLSGPPGSYKTFLAITMSCCLATRTPLLGRDVPERGMAVYVTAEGANDLHKRLLAWCEAADVEPSELLDWLRVLPMPIQLGDKVDATQAVEVVQDLKAAMLVLDTRARCTLGLEENSASEQGLAIAAADRIRNAADCSVLAVHHTPRTGNAGRGSNAWDGAVWSDLRIEGSKLAAKVHCEKHKDVPSGCDHDFTLTRHVVGLDLLPGLDAEERTTLVLSPTDAAGLSAKLTTARHLVGQTVWELAPPEGLTATDLLEVTGVSKTRLYDATVWGIAQGFIHNVGTARRSRWTRGKNRPPWLPENG